LVCKRGEKFCAITTILPTPQKEETNSKPLLLIASLCNGVRDCGFSRASGPLKPTYRAIIAFDPR
jgi:hypothetical protein